MALTDFTTAIANVNASATIAASYALQQAQFKLIDAWLSDTDTDIGAAKHISAGLKQQQLSVVQAVLTSPKNKANNLGGYVSSLFMVSPKQAQYMNELNSMFQQPNIEGIVIFTESEQTTREMDVSTSPMVVQQDLVSTTYVTDNAVPKPRSWSLKGHLATTLSTDHYFVIKPSLMLQRNYLDNCMRTRKPVWFKTYDNQFIKVLISNMQTAWDPKSMNTMSISLSLVEYSPIYVTDSPLTPAIASKLGISFE